MRWLSVVFQAASSRSSRSTAARSKRDRNRPVRTVRPKPSIRCRMPAIRQLTRGHQQPCQGHVGVGVSDARVRPIDDHGPRLRQHDVQRMQVEMQQARTLADGRDGQEVRWRNLVQPPVQRRQRVRRATQRPRCPAQRVDQRPAIDTFHDEAAAVIEQLLDGRHRIPVAQRGTPSCGLRSPESG